METLLLNDNIPFNDEDVSPVIKDIVINIFEKCKNDLQDTKNKKTQTLNQKHIKIQESYQTEKQHVTTLENEIQQDKAELKNLNLDYLLEKQLSVGLQNKIKKIELEYKNILTKCHTRIDVSNESHIKLMNLMDQQKLIYDTKKEHENQYLFDEITVYNTEINRIKNQKENIEIELQSKLAQTITDYEIYDSKIIHKEKIINLLQSDIKNIEKISAGTRRQFIKINKAYINKHKTLKKVKNKFQTQISNINTEIYTLDNNKKLDIKKLTDSSIIIEDNYRKEITNRNNIVKELNIQLENIKNNAINTKSKTWQINYDKLSDELDNKHQALTESIQSFNAYLSQKREQIHDMTNQYNNDIEYKKNHLKVIETKLQRIHNGEDNKISKMNYQYQLNNKIIKEKLDVLNNEYQSIQQLHRDKYEYQCLANKYESNSNQKIINLGNDIERAQERLIIIKKRFADNITKYDNLYRNNIIDYTNQIEKIRDDITNNTNIIDNLDKKIKNNQKEITNHNNKLQQIRHQIKDLERIISGKEARLSNLKVRVESRLKTIKEREQEIIDLKMKNDLDFVTKMNTLNQVNDGNINEKINVLNKLMDIKI